jgi:hypothetical protein
MRARFHILSVAACCVGGIAAAPTAFAADASAISTCTLTTAYMTADNDIRLDNDHRPKGIAVPLPAAVAAAIKTSAETLVGKLDPGSTDGMKCADIIGDTYRVSLLEKREFYVAYFHIPAGIEYFSLVLFDRSSGAVTRQPAMIGAKWTEGFGTSDPFTRQPFVSSADLLQNGHRQIVFEERVHNGTVYNGVVYHYFEVGNDLELTRILAHEASVDIFDHLYTRELTRLAPNRLRLDTFSTSNIDGGGARPAGYAILERDGVGLPFKVVESHPVDKDMIQGLITFSGEPGGDDAFLRDGFTGYY